MAHLKWNSSMLLPFLFSSFLSLWAAPVRGQQCETSRYEHRHRAFIATDISNEPDDQMSLVRFLAYANELHIQGIAAVTSTWKKDSLDTASIHKVISAYGNVTENLNANVPSSAGYPPAESLHSKVSEGHPVYGLAALNLTTSGGALALIDAADAASPDDPLWVCVWGGANIVAEALQLVSRKRGPKLLSKFIEKIRVYSISDQDDAGVWIRVNYPSLFYIVSLHGWNDYTQAGWRGISGDIRGYMDQGGPDTSLVTNDWLETHIRVGELGAVYPNFTVIMEGDTPSFFPLIQNGLGDPAHPEWGSWGGRFTLVDISGRYPLYSDTSDLAVGSNGKNYISTGAAIWRWREAYQYDFAARMQWTTNADYKANNHQPIVIVNGTCGPKGITIPYSYGSSVILDASASWDPDGDELSYNWLYYREVIQRVQEGDIDKLSSFINVTNLDSTGSIVNIRPMENQTMHIVLSVQDNKDMSLITYRRIIITPTA